MKQELWKVIPFESNYEVSTLGRVRNVSTQQVKSQRLDKYGYKRVTLYPSGKTYNIHRLVLLTYVGQQEGKQVNHIDFDKGNNQLFNLEWCSVRENCIHREKYLNPNRINGSSNPMSRYTDVQVLHMRCLYDNGKTCADIAELYKGSDETIRRIVKRISWQHI
ncbi:HNH endonuclease [Xanthomonas phage DES1]|nr:HNH endonuclease [Xanthomonas phage DES1]